MSKTNKNRKANSIMQKITITIMFILTVGFSSSLMADTYGDIITSTPGITNYWRFSETSGTAISDSVGNDNGISSGVTLGVSGPRPSNGFSGMPTGNTAFDYNGGGSSRFSTAVNLLTNGINTLSVSAWFKLDAAGSDTTRQVICGYQQNAGIRYNFIIARMESSKLKFYIKVSDGAQISSEINNTAYNIAATNSIWHNIVLCWDGSVNGDGIATTYLDGSNVMSFSSSGINSNIATSSDSFVVGNDIIGGNGFDGVIDEVAVFDRVLSEDEVADQYAAKQSVYVKAVHNLAPVHYWRLGESTGGADKYAHDTVGKKNGIYTAVAGNGPRPTNGFLGFSSNNGALSYNGVWDSITFSDPDNLGPVKKFSSGISNVTITVWVRSDNVTNGLHVIGGYQTGSLSTKYAFLCQYDASSDYFTYYAKDTDGSQDFPTASFRLTDTNWHMLAWSWDGSTMRMYMDGGDSEESAGGDASGNLHIPEQLTFAEGEGLGRTFDGQLDEIAIFDRTLTAAEITTLYNAALNIPKGTVIVIK